MEQTSGDAAPAKEGEADAAPPVAKATDSDRESGVVAAVEEWNRALPPADVKDKYERLGGSALSFFCGTNHLFWADFSGDERLSRFGGVPETRTWISGNCHVDSFRSSGGDAEGPMYGLHEFDEAVIADYQYDVWRFAVSIVLFVRGSEQLRGPDGGGGGGGGGDAAKAAVTAFAARFLRAVVGYKPGQASDSGGDSGGGSGGGGGGARERLSALLAFAGGNIRGRLVRFLAVVEREYSRRKLLKKWCSEDGARHTFRSMPGQLQPCPRGEADAVAVAFGYYADTCRGAAGPHHGVNVKDVVRVVGHSSAAPIGNPRFYVLAEAAGGELHVLDAARQLKPTAYHFMRPADRAEHRGRHANDAARHADAMLALSSTLDPYNGWIQLKDGIHPAAAGFYSVRDLSPYEEAFPAAAPDDPRSKLRGFALTSQEALVELCEDWGRILGTQQARAAAELEVAAGSGPPPPPAEQRPRFGRVVAQLAKVNRGGFESLVWEIARTYGERVEEDWLAFKKHLLPLEHVPWLRV